MLKKCKTDGCDNSQRYTVKDGKTKSAGSYCLQCTTMRRRAYSNGKTPEFASKEYLVKFYWDRKEKI